MKRINAISRYIKGSVEKDAKGVLTELDTDKVYEPTFFRISDTDAWKFYLYNEIINATINRIVRDCTRIVPVFSPRDKNKEIDDKLKKNIETVNQFFANPNKNKEPFCDIRKKVLKDALIFGRGTVEKIVDKDLENTEDLDEDDEENDEGDDSRKILEIYSLPARDVRMLTDEHGTLPQNKAYAQTVKVNKKSGKKDTNTKKEKEYIYFDRDEVIMMILEPVSGYNHGIKILDALANAVATDILRNNYNSNIFVNGGEAAGVFTMEGAQDGEIKKFRQHWDAAHKGVKNAHRIAVSNRKIEFVRMALTNRDMQFAEYGVELQHKIFAAFGMQPMIMGMVDGTTGKLNSEQQVELYKQGALIPLLMMEKFYYENEIIKQGLGIEDVIIEFPGIDFADAIKQSEIERNDVQNAILTINEVRARRGLNPVAWGNAPVIVLPGGNQIDPETGRMIKIEETDVAAQSKPLKKPKEKKPKKKSNAFFKYCDSLRNRIEAFIQHYPVNEDFTNIKFDDVTTEKQLFYNGKAFKMKAHKFPVELKETKIYKDLDAVFDFKYYFAEDDSRCEYINCFLTKVKHVVLDHYIKKDNSDLLEKIDTIFYCEKLEPIVSEIF